jgi:hypothetical protein
MQLKTRDTDTEARDGNFEKELAGLLSAISIVSERLSKKLLTRKRQTAVNQRGGIPREQGE